MPDILELVRHWWKQIFLVVILSLLAVGVITFLKPRQYLSVATAVPASTYATDRSAVFNGNIQALYSSLGTADDLDRIVGTANLDTTYLAVTDQYNLYDHYKLKEKGMAARTTAATLLRQHTKVMKSEYGELKVKVWDTDKDLAPQLANAIMEQLQAMHRDLQSAGNENALAGLKKGKEKLALQMDSLASPEKSEQLRKQAEQYEKLIGEYQLMVDSKPLSLVVVEKAKAAEWPDKPKRMQIMVATGVLSLLFALLAALVMERRKNVQP